MRFWVVKTMAFYILLSYFDSKGTKHACILSSIQSVQFVTNRSLLSDRIDFSPLLLHLLLQLSMLRKNADKGSRFIFYHIKYDTFYHCVI